MVSRSAAAELNRQYRQNRSDIEALHERVDETNKIVKETNTKVDNLTTEVSTLRTDLSNLDTKFEAKFDSLDTKFEGKFDQVNSRFDRLEALIMSPRNQDKLPGSDVLRTPHEKQVDPYEKRFDHLDNQMAEVLGILRSKTA